MKTLLPLAIGMAATLFATDWAGAQEVRYDLTGNYPNTAPSTSLTAPGGAFDFQFLVPASVANSVRPSDPFFITAPQGREMHGAPPFFETRRRLGP